MTKIKIVWQKLLAVVLCMTITASCFGGMIMPMDAAARTLSGNNTLSGNTPTDDILPEDKPTDDTLSENETNKDESKEPDKEIEPVYLSAVKLKISSISYNKIKLSWSKNSKANGYKVYRKNSEGKYVCIKTIKSGSTLTYTNEGLTVGKTYYYKVAPVLITDEVTHRGDYSSVVQGKTRLSVPKISDVKNINYKTLQILWNKISGASGYEIYRATSSSGTYKLVKRITSGSTLSYKDTTVTPNKTRYYKVRAYRTVNGKRVYSSFSAIDSGKSMFTKVKNVAVKATDYKTLKITWDKVSNASKYQVYYSTSKNSGFKKLATVKGTSYKWSKATCGKTYYFKVRAIKTENSKDIYGTYSSVVSGKTKIGKTTASIAKKTYNSIKISWEKVSGAQEYQIYWATSKNGTYKKLKTTTRTYYTHTGRKPGKTYYYKVRAIRQNSKSSFSKIVSAKTSLGTVTGLKVTKYGEDGLKISWNEANGATSYKVYRATSENGKYKELATVKKKNYVDKGLISSKKYYYKVVGYRDSYKTKTAGPVSGSVRFTRQGVDLSKWQGKIDWDAVENAGIEFAMLRVVEGKVPSMSVDYRFEEYYKNATERGIDVGVYRYCYATTIDDVKKEAKKVLEVLDGRKLDYPVVLDMEDNCLLASNITNDTRSKMVLEFKKIVEDAGYEFAMYANLNWLMNYFDMDQLEDIDIWLARWRSYEKGPGYTGKGNLIMWQYSASGTVPGISGYVDLDVTY